MLGKRCIVQVKHQSQGGKRKGESHWKYLIHAAGSGVYRQAEEPIKAFYVLCVSFASSDKYLDPEFLRCYR